jgi:hypothetical protein
MSNTVPSEHPTVVVRSSRQHLLALLAIAIAFIVGISIAVAVFATRGDRSIPATIASPAPPSAIPAHPSVQTTAKLDHSGRNAAVAHTSDRLANYPDAPPASAGSPQPSISYYLNPPQP